MRVDLVTGRLGESVRPVRQLAGVEGPRYNPTQEVAQLPQTVVIPGRLVDRKTVELESPAPAEATRAEVVIRLDSATPQEPSTLIEVLRGLPRGRRTKREIDQQIEDERASWER